MDPWAVAFTIIMVALWMFCMVWAWQTRRYLAVVLLIASTYAYWSEFGAIHFQMYFYDRLKLASFFPFTLPALPAWLAALIPVTPGSTCLPNDHVIPIGIFAMEGILLLSLYRTSHLMGMRWWVAPFADGLIAVIIDALLDPISARSVLCLDGGGDQPLQDALSFWVWRTSESNLGAFYGIPIANYLAWFLGVFAFSFAIRAVAKWTNIDSVAESFSGTGPPNPGTLFADFPPALLAIILLIIFEVIITLPIRWIFYMKPGNVQWQAGVFITLLVLSLLVVIIFRRPLKRDNEFVWAIILPQVAFPVFCLVALFVKLWGERSMVLPVGIVATLIGLLFAFAPYKQFWALLGVPPAPPV